MKKFLSLVFVALTLVVGAAAHAGPSHINVLEVKQFGNLMPPIPPGVNPVNTLIKITYNACGVFGQDSFEVVLAAEGGDLVPTLIVRPAPELRDCMGPSFVRELTLKRNTLGILDKVMAEQNGRMVELKVDQSFVY